MTGATQRALLAIAAIATTAALLLPAGAAAGERIPATVWLCKPGIANNPCTPNQDTTRFSPSGRRLGVDDLDNARRPKVDCFYVYPTVSDQQTLGANLEIDPEQRSIALYQAARYSRTCNVYAPMYRQITLVGLRAPGTAPVARRAYADVREAWRTYLRRHNRGRGVVIIGHSQGTFMLRRLITEEVDPRPSVRRRLVSALLLGGNVLVRTGRDAGGDFQHVRACRRRGQIGCVIAFSTFNAPAPANAVFGRTNVPNREVLCTNPATLLGSSNRITPVYPSAPFAPGTTIGIATELVGSLRPAASTPWVSIPRSYGARCSSAGGADVLQITPFGGAPALRPTPDATWGTHLVDANIALGDLDAIVRLQAAEYIERRSAGVTG